MKIRNVTGKSTLTERKDEGLKRAIRVSKMAAKTEQTCLKEVMTFLHLLANTNRKTNTESSSETTGINSFEGLLSQNVFLVRSALAKDTTAVMVRLREFEELRMYLDELFYEKISDLENNSPVDTRERKTKDSVDTSKNANIKTRWLFVEVCLRTLLLLRET